MEEIDKHQKIEVYKEYSIDEIEEKQAEFWLKNWIPIPRRTVSIVSAPGGTGKSWFVLQLAIRFLVENQDKKAFLWLSEDPKELTKHRASKIWQEVLKFANDVNMLADRLKITDNETPQILEEYERGHRIAPLWFNLQESFKRYD